MATVKKKVARATKLTRSSVLSDKERQQFKSFLQMRLEWWEHELSMALGFKKKSIIEKANEMIRSIKSELDFYIDTHHKN